MGNDAAHKAALHQTLAVLWGAPRGWRGASTSLTEPTRLRMLKLLCFAVVLYQGLARELICKEEEEEEEEPAAWEKGR